MTLPRFDGMCGVTGAIVADRQGRVLAHSTRPELAHAGAATALNVIGPLGAAGELAGLSRLEVLVVRSAGRASATALREDRFLVADLDPAGPSAPAEKALGGWALSAAGDGASQGVFSGCLSVFAIEEVLQFLRGARSTGLLVCTCARGEASVRFHDGRIADVDVPGAPRLGDVLLRAYALSPSALRAVSLAADARQPDDALGARLVREDLVEAPAVEDALRWKVELGVRELARWRDGEFTFEPGGVQEPATDGPWLCVDVQQVLLSIPRDPAPSARRAEDGEAAESRGSR
jgi:Domain of unknown function (DUF4388)